jgi:hypothetical protein
MIQRLLWHIAGVGTVGRIFKATAGVPDGSAVDVDAGVSRAEGSPPVRIRGTSPARKGSLSGADAGDVHPRTRSLSHPLARGEYPAPGGRFVTWITGPVLQRKS